MASARVGRRDLVRQPHRRHLTDAAPQRAPSPGRRPTSTSCAGPATAPETATSPSCTTQVRHAHGRNPEPSAGLIDSCSIKVSPVRGPRGFDGAKKIDGIKRHVVDTLACWWPCLSPRPACRIGRRCLGCSAEPATAAPGLGHLWAEQGYTGSVVRAVSRILQFTIQIVGGIKVKGGFIIQPRRWVVERTFAWMHRCRRLTRQYEQTPLAHEAVVVISQLALMLRRLDRMTEPRHHDGVVR
jgi:transposase